MRQKYYTYPFASAGSTTPTIPDATDPSGFVSYEIGFTFDYQRVLIAGPGNVPPADPLAKSPTWINFNAILNDATTNIQQYQQNGIPEYITPGQAGGSAYNYGCGAMVLYSASGSPPFVPYMALIATTSTPGADATWLNLLTLAAPVSHGVVAFLGAGTYSFTAPVGVTTVVLDMSAAGGAGGFGTIATVGGGGASSGMNVLGYPLTVVPGTTYTITLGAAGTITGGDGNSGAVSTFGTLLTLQGGAGGKNNGTPGASVGANSQAGIRGCATSTTISFGGAGGGTLFGNGASGGMVVQVGQTGTAPGTGGGGGGDNNGGNGGPPYCRISW